MTSSSPLRKIAAVLLLVLLLGAPWAAAAAPRAVPPWRAAGLGDLLVQVWSALTVLWGDAGCSLDPNGRCQGAPTLDEGCSADPSGRCKGATVPMAPPPTLDEGCSLDPDGRCLGGR